MYNLPDVISTFGNSCVKKVWKLFSAAFWEDRFVVVKRISMHVVRWCAPWFSMPISPDKGKAIPFRARSARLDAFPARPTSALLQTTVLWDSGTRRDSTSDPFVQQLPMPRPADHMKLAC